MICYIVTIDYGLEPISSYQLDGIYLTEEAAMKRIDRLHKRHPGAYIALGVEKIRGKV